MNAGEYDKVIICGNSIGEGIIKANKLEVNGSFIFNGIIECPSILINGLIQTSTISSKKIEINGKVDCDEIISDYISICSSNDCSIDSVKCEVLITRPSKGLFHRFKNKTIITINTIACEQAEVSNLFSNQMKCTSLKAAERTNIKKVICKQCNADESVTINDIIYE
jgi:hypothetical protein